MKNNKFLRQCISCRNQKTKEELIRITKNNQNNLAQININNEIEGRYVYICKNEHRIENAFKKNRIEGLLKCKLPENIKLEVYTILKN